MVSLEWHDIDAVATNLEEKKSWVPWNRKEKQYYHRPYQRILTKISGQASPGTLTTIVGPGGAGRTTLLSILSNRMAENLTLRLRVRRFETPGIHQVTGDILLNNSHHNYKRVNQISAVVDETDMMVGVLTVREHLWFQATLRLGNYTSRRRMARIDQLISELGLKKCENAPIGIVGVLKGISGGERKRLCFATELLSDPPLLFCDEPTTGLDSFMAESVIRTLRRMAANGKTVICTARVVSSSVYALLEHVIWMAEGRVAFDGHPRDALQHFQQLGYECPPTYNPADYFLHLLTIRRGENIGHKLDEIKQICEAFEPTPVALEELDKGDGSSFHSIDLGQKFLKLQNQKTTIVTQFHALLWRSWTTNIRDKGIYKIRYITLPITALLLSLCYFRLNIDHPDQKAIMNISGALNIIIMIGWDNAFVMISSFFKEMRVFKKEYDNGLYGPGVYYLARVVAATPHFILIATIWTMIVYWMLGLKAEAIPFFTDYAMITILLLTAAAYGSFIAVVYRGNITLAINAGPMPMIVFWLTGGFYLNVESIPAALNWIQYISWYRYIYDALMVSQWSTVSNITCEFDRKDMCLHTGKEVLNSYSMGEAWPLWVDFVVMVAMIGVYHMLGFITLKLLHRRKQMDN